MAKQAFVFCLLLFLLLLFPQAAEFPHFCVSWTRYSQFGMWAHEMQLQGMRHGWGAPLHLHWLRGILSLTSPRCGFLHCNANNMRCLAERRLSWPEWGAVPVACIMLVTLLPLKVSTKQIINDSFSNLLTVLLGHFFKLFNTLDPKTDRILSATLNLALWIFIFLTINIQSLQYAQEFTRY